MVSTANLIELMEIIHYSHGDPHHILGMHEILLDDKPCLVVRVFIPQAASVSVIDPVDDRFVRKMDKVHVDGFFELVIRDRAAWFRYMLSIEGQNHQVWTTYDPYAFPPLITEVDLHLIGEGNHYRIFDKLGANPTVVDGIEGVLFGVWVPNAKRVSVIGDFNGWNSGRHMMRSLGNSGIWELFIPGLCNYDKYKFEIQNRHNAIFQKADPYAHFNELRPNTSSMVYNINEYTWADAEWMENRNENNPLDGPVNIYEVHLGSWRKAESDGNRFLSYIEMIDTLIPYVKDMGYTHIELMPVLEHPFDGSWGYQVTGYYAPTSRYGSPDEFMAFVDACHQNGIGVLLDWVPAHFPKDAHGLAKFDGTALYEHEDPRLGEHPDWGTLIFNFGRNEVKNFLLGNAIFWLEKYHLDGLRVDAVASMLYLDYGKEDGQWVPNKYGGKENLDAVEFMKHMNSIIMGRYPHVLMIAEESTAWAGVSRPVEQGGLGFNLKWNMGWMNDFLSYMSKDSIFRKYHHNSLTFSMVYAYTENFILVLSHDEVVHGKGSLIQKMPGDMWQKFANLRAAYGMMYGHPGKKLLFMGGEIAQFVEWNEAKSIEWFMLDFPYHNQMQAYVRDLNHLYRNEKAFWYDDFKGNGFEWISCQDANRSIVSFMRKSETDKEMLIFICNFTPEAFADYRVGVPNNFDYQEIFNSDDPKYGGSGVVNTKIRHPEEQEWDGQPYSFGLRLPPLGITVFKPVK